LPGTSSGGAARSGCGGGVPEMADLAYVLLLIGGFALLVLTLRGLQRL
jgi:hypothetical protein